MYFLNELKEGLFIAYKAIMANKMRSALTTLGIIIGIVSVTLMGTAIEGLNRAFENSISKMGADVYYVQKWPWFHGEDWWKYRNRKDIYFKEAMEFQKQMKGVEAVSYGAGAGSGKGIIYKDRLMTGIFVIGSDEQYVKVLGAYPQNGRFFTTYESDGGRPVCVIGSEVADGLFPNEDPVGKTLKVRGYNFKIVGILEKQGSFLGAFSFDTRIIIPMFQFVKIYGSRRSVQISVKVGSKDRMEDAREEIRGLMRKIRKVPAWKEDDFAINQQEMFTQAFNSISAVISLVGLFITGLSLFVGSIGIMNVMFVSVTERTKEIGIRKALGAKRRTILFQFLVESITITLIGGLIGLIIAFPVSLIIDQILPTAMPLSIVIIALLVSVVIGVISGILPAMRASKMDPVDALRYE
jgi:putative ABC transport system permease protein